jgi:hypothetical protein
MVSCMLPFHNIANDLVLVDDLLYGVILASFQGSNRLSFTTSFSRVRAPLGNVRSIEVGTNGRIRNVVTPFQLTPTLIGTFPKAL